MNEIAFLPKRLTLPEPPTERAVDQWRRDVTKFLQDVAANAQLTRYDAGQVATGAVRLGANAQDGDTVTVIVGAQAVLYEFDDDAAVTLGRVPVTIGGNAVVTTGNLAEAITTAQGARLTAVQHAEDTTVIDLAAKTAGAVFTLTESTAGTRIAVQDSGNEQAQGRRYQFATRRTVTAADVTRGRIVLQTALTEILWWQVLVQEAATIPAATDFDGAVTRTAGVLEIENSGSSALVAGNVILVQAEGIR